MSAHSRVVAVLAAGPGLFMLPVARGAQPDYIMEEQTAPATVEGTKQPIGGGFVEEEPVPSYFPGLEQKLEPLSPFWRDTSLTIKPRTYYFDRHREEARDSTAWALGGSLDYLSGWWRERLRVGAVLYTSQKLYGPSDKDGTLLLEPGQEGFTVLGQAYLEGRLNDELWLRVGRQAFNLPYVNRFDNRMVPNTFEAYTLGGDATADLAFIVSHVRKMKTRNSSEFVYMSEAAGFDGTDKGLTMAGARYSFGADANIGAINQYAWDFMNTFYAEATASWKLTDQTSLRASAQYTDQRSVGEELDGDFSTHVVGGKLATSHQGAILSFAFSTTSQNSRIRNPFGGYPGYLSLMIKNFYRAGEDAWLLGVAYDFGGLGVKGLSAFANYARGNTPNSGTAASPAPTSAPRTSRPSPPAASTSAATSRTSRSSACPQSSASTTSSPTPTPSCRAGAPMR